MLSSCHLPKGIINREALYRTESWDLSWASWPKSHIQEGSTLSVLLLSHATRQFHTSPSRARLYYASCLSGSIASPSLPQLEVSSFQLVSFGFSHLVGSQGSLFPKQMTLYHGPPECLQSWQKASPPWRSHKKTDFADGPLPPSGAKKLRWGMYKAFKYYLKRWRWRLQVVSFPLFCFQYFKVLFKFWSHTLFNWIWILNELTLTYQC